MKPTATGFLVQVELTENPTPRFCCYVVTARHVIEDDRMAPVVVRANTRDGNSTYITTDGLSWFVHDQADVACHMLDVNEPLGVSAVSVGNFVLSPVYDYQVTLKVEGESSTFRQRIQTGDEIASLGLFLEDFGTSGNVPVARFGHIARMPSVVHTPRWRGDEFRSVAYLVECTSWPGMSGSPVYWFQRVNEAESLSGKVVATREKLIPALVGCISGHVNRGVKTALTRGDESTEDVIALLNTGIATVTPATAIWELLTRQDVVEDRLEVAAKEGVPGPYVSLDKSERLANQD